MISWISQGSYFKGAVFYGAGKHDLNKSTLIDTNNLFSADHAGIAREMKLQADLSTRCKKPVLHASMSFDENISTVDMLKAANLWFEQMKIDKKNHQIAIYEHHDTDHKHIHVFINRVGLDAKAYEDKFIKYKNKEACRAVELELGLKIVNSFPGKDGQTQKDSSLKFDPREKDPHKKEVRIYVNNAIEKALISAENRDELQYLLGKSGIKAYFKDDSQGNFVGASFYYNNLTVTGKSVEFTGPILKEHFNRIQNPGEYIRFEPEEIKEISKKLNEIWKKERFKLTGKFYESQQIANYPFAELAQILRNTTGLSKEKSFLAVQQFELFQKKRLPKIEEKELYNFNSSVQTYVQIADNIKGNSDSRRLFMEALTLKYKDGEYSVSENPKLIHKETPNEKAILDSNKYPDTVYIPGTISKEERSLLIKAISGKPITESHFDLNAARLKSILTNDFWDKISAPLNANYVERVLGKAPHIYEDRMAYLAQRGIVITENSSIKSGFEIGFIGNRETGELQNRVPVSEAMGKYLKENGFTKTESELNNEHAKTKQGQMMIALAQAIDTQNNYQIKYIMSLMHKYNPNLKGVVTSPDGMLEILSRKKKTDSNKDLRREANKIRWKNKPKF